MLNNMVFDLSGEYHKDGESHYTLAHVIVKAVWLWVQEIISLV